ncbi:MAG: transposase [Anaerolineae bacterium]
MDSAPWTKNPKGAALSAPAHARRKARKAARKNKHRTPDERTLLAAGFVLVLTNLPVSAWPAQDVLGLYRFRWQVEMLIKRLKSLLALDGLRARDPHLAQAYLRRVRSTRAAGSSG